MHLQISSNQRYTFFIFIVYNPTNFRQSYSFSQCLLVSHTSMSVLASLAFFFQEISNLKLTTVLCRFQARFMKKRGRKYISLIILGSADLVIKLKSKSVGLQLPREAYRSTRLLQPLVLLPRVIMSSAGDPRTIVKTNTLGEETPKNKFLAL